MAQPVGVWCRPRLRSRRRLMAAARVWSCCRLGLGASVSEFSVAVGYHPGDDPFHGGSVLVVAG